MFLQVSAQVPAVVIKEGSFNEEDQILSDSYCDYGCGLGVDRLFGRRQGTVQQSNSQSALKDGARFRLPQGLITMKKARLFPSRQHLPPDGNSATGLGRCLIRKRPKPRYI